VHRERHIQYICGYASCAHAHRAQVARPEVVVTGGGNVFLRCSVHSCVQYLQPVGHLRVQDNAVDRQWKDFRARRHTWMVV